MTQPGFSGIETRNEENIYSCYGELRVKEEYNDAIEFGSLHK